MPETSKRIGDTFAGLLLLAGSALFLWGGSQHPPTVDTLGPIGSDAYFRSFADHIVRHSGWQRIHTAILVGPVLWALGLAAARGEAAGRLAVTALAMGAALWAVAFVFDGFLAPQHAAAVAAGRGGGIDALRATQTAVIRLGLLSWLLFGVGIAAVGAGLLTATTSVPRRVLGVAGLALGAWPWLAWAVGVFDPGPFTSDTWRPTALATAAWFLALASTLVFGSERPKREARRLA